MRVLTWGKVSSGLLVSVMAGCGGDGGGYGSMTPAPTSMMPAPTVSISQPAAAASINFGQTLTVAWTSANTTSCTATTSSAAGGTFTGTQMTSGSQSVVPTAAGNYTYTLSCTGTGGTQSASVSVTVTTNLLNALAPTGPIPTVGSTIDPTIGDQNPYGLTVAPATAGLITQGDLIVCNFNDATITTPPSGNVQGTGTTIIGLHPGSGSQPYHIAQSADLLGCDALAMLPDDSISAAAWASNLNPLVSATGTVGTPFAGDTFNGPWGEAFVAATATQPAALYVSSAPGNNGVVAGSGSSTSPGTINRISLDTNNVQTSLTEVVTGFCSGGAPGAIYGPAGLTYDPASDTLYVIDTSSASVIALAGVSAIPQDGVVVNGQCTATTPTPVPTFSGPSMASARVIAHGAPFNTPLSAALLKNGDLVVGNADIGLTAPSATTNLLIEVSPVVPGGFVGQPLQIDTGSPGAIFGIAATVDAAGNQIIYFNDDNNSAVMQLGPIAATPTTPGY
jgi:hypothetical protein